MIKFTRPTRFDPRCRVQPLSFRALLCASALFIVLPHPGQAAPKAENYRKSGAPSSRMATAAAHAPQKKRSTAHVARTGGNETMTISASRVASRGADNVVSKAVMAQFTPGTSVLKAVDRLPGVSFSSTDRSASIPGGRASMCAAFSWISSALHSMVFR